MNRKDRSTVLTVVTLENLQTFVSTNRIPLELLPCLPGLLEPTTCSSDRIMIYTPSFSFDGVCYPLPSFKMELFKHYWIHISQVHPLAFIRVVHFELTFAAFFGALLVPLFRRFYRLRTDKKWFTF
ncbi:hypothetical protein Hanom_Chr15g01376911 [Helianthus anomalus]